MGSDLRLQILHEYDSSQVLKRAAHEDRPGLFHVAGEGIIYLSRALRLGGRWQIPVAPPVFPLAATAMRMLGMVDVQPYHGLLLRYGRAIDLNRLKTKFGYQPRYSTVEAVLDLYDRSTISREPWIEVEEPEEEEKVAAA